MVRTLGGPPSEAAPARIRRLLAENQRLLVFPIAQAVLGALLYLPLVLAVDGVPSFAAFVRDELGSLSLQRVVDDPAGAGAGAVLALVGRELGTAVAGAWLGGAFLRSIEAGRIVNWPGRTLFLRLLVLYAAVAAIGLAMLQTANPGLFLLSFVVLAVPTLYADLAMAFDGASLSGGVVASTRFFRRTLGRSLLAVFGLLFLAAAVGQLLYDQVEGSSGVFPPFYLAALLVAGLLLYVQTCVLVGLYADRNAGDPASTTP